MPAANTVTTSDLVVDHDNGVRLVHALSHRAMSVPGGTSAAIMGPSGCGKSTLLGLLAGLALPTSGTVSIGDVTISDLADSARAEFRRGAIGMVYQADNLLPHLTVEENVALPVAIGRRAGSAPGSDPLRLLDRLGLGALAARFPDQLSGGQRQRVAVARAIVNRPMLILADEPTGALDDDNARGVVELLTEVQRDLAATLIVVTHDPAIAAYCDNIEYLGQPVAQEMADGR